MMGGQSSIFVFATVAALMLATSAQAAEYRFYHPDALGSNVVVTNRSGEVVQRMAHTPYGELRSVVDGVGNSISPGANDPRHHFTGHEQDAESGLHYMGARYYDPFVGRFMNQDPIVRGGPLLSPNGYMYANNRPTALIDPTGLFPTASPAPSPSEDDLFNQRMREMFPNYDPDNPTDIFGTGIDPLNFAGAGMAKNASRYATTLTQAAFKKIGDALGKSLKGGVDEAVTQELKGSARSAAAAATRRAGAKATQGKLVTPEELDILGRPFRTTGTKTMQLTRGAVGGNEFVVVGRRASKLIEIERVFSDAQLGALRGGHPKATAIFQEATQGVVYDIRSIARARGFEGTGFRGSNGVLIFSAPMRALP